jgi:DNA repair protein RecN (Recombination protein N)
MLTELAVENLGVIERAVLALEAGCSAVTGETGAGKTLIVTALELLAGGRGDPAAIKSGAQEARVEGRFLIRMDHPVVQLLLDNGIIDATETEASDDLELVITRTVSPAASKARLNGRLVTIGLLGEVGGSLLDVVGQHSRQRLFAPDFQRAAVDGFAGPEAVALAQEVAEAARSVGRKQRERDELQTNELARTRELDVVRYEVAEIEAARLQEGERERLLADAAGLEEAEAIATGAAEAVLALSGEGGAEDTLVQAAKALEPAGTKAPVLRALRDRAIAIHNEVSDITLELRRASIEPDPAALEHTRERLDLIARLCRKFGPDESDVLHYLEVSRQRAEELAGLPERVAEVTRELDERTKRVSSLSKQLSQLRSSAAPRLQEAIEALLAELALEGAKVEVRLEECEPNEGGAESVQLFADLAGTGEPRPLKKVASGGELSRVALALHLVAVKDGPGTMVFDEVDSGVGGEAARALGRCLARLARSSGAQVLVVTHLPQVAASADNHYRVSKTREPGRGGATVVRVEGDERVSELSRMLAGLPRSDRAHQHARELLELGAEAS